MMASLDRRRFLSALVVSSGLLGSERANAVGVWFRAQNGAPVAYPLGVLAAGAWAQDVYGLSDPTRTVCRVPKASLKVPGVDDLPSGWAAVPKGTPYRGRLIPTADNASLLGWDLSLVYITSSTYRGMVLTDCYTGPDFINSGSAQGASAWVMNPGSKMSYCTIDANGATNMGIPITLPEGCEMSFCRIVGSQDDPIRVGVAGSGRTTTLVHDNYFADPNVPPNGHVDAVTIAAGSLKYYRNLASGKVRQFNNNAFRIAALNGSIYDAEFYNNISEGYEGSISYTIQSCQDTYLPGIVQNISIHDNVVSKTSNSWYYPSQETGIILSSGNIDTVTGLPITEVDTSNNATLTTPGTISQDGSNVLSVAGEVWNKAAASADTYQWVYVTTDTGSGLPLFTPIPLNSGSVTYTRTSGDVGKTVARVTARSTGPLAAGKPAVCTTGVSNSFTIAA